jgi:hypothetical protein
MFCAPDPRPTDVSRLNILNDRHFYLCERKKDGLDGCVFDTSTACLDANLDVF